MLETEHDTKYQSVLASIIMKNPPVAIVISTYNGERFLAEQLHSLASQSMQSFDLYIRDDGSTDSTLQIIRQFQESSSISMTLLESTGNVGTLKSFEILLKTALSHEAYEYFMFCDQDDVWFADKVEVSYRAITRLQQHCGSVMPLLIYTDLQVVDETLQVLGESFWRYFHLNPQKNRCSDIAMQCNVTGCTMIFNRSLAAAALPFESKAVMHDHWLALIASALGAVDYIDKPTLSYRQHGNNVSGGAPKFNVAYIVRKARKYWQNNEFYEVLGRQIDQADVFVERYASLCSSECLEALRAMTRLSSSSISERVVSAVRYGLYKHGLLRNIGLFFWLLKPSAGNRT